MKFVEKNLELIAIKPQPKRRLRTCEDDQVSQDCTNGLNKNLLWVMSELKFTFLFKEMIFVLEILQTVAVKIC